VGTISEMMVMWNEMITGGLSPRPLILVGSEWNAVLSQFIDSLGIFVGLQDRELVQLVPDIDTAFEKIQSW
jgi:predicted Rossmann-fold nucleotide-binding protein